MSTSRLCRSLVALCGCLALCAALFPGAAGAQVPLDPLTQPKFAFPLYNPPILSPSGPNAYDVTVSETMQWMGLINPVTKAHLLTKVWAYGNTVDATQPAHMPGPTIVAAKDTPITITWRNGLPAGGHFLPVDTSYLEYPTQPTNAIVTHVHGGHVSAAADGTPLQYYTPDGVGNGPAFPGIPGTNYVTNTYPNDQDAATIWYHDHAMGLTRLNPYAGMAGFYLIFDNIDTVDGSGLNIPGITAGGAYDIGLAIQDKDFYDDGSLAYPTDTNPPVPGAPVPSSPTEFFGNFMLVNGVTWPYLDVEPRKYRFRIVNGCNSRFLGLWLNKATGGQPYPMYQIGSDQGLLPVSTVEKNILLAPGERVDIIIDFSGIAMGSYVTMMNNAPGPYPFGPVVVDRRTTANIMKFRVVKPLVGTDTTVIPQTPRAMTTLEATTSVPVREHFLLEDLDAFGRLRQTLDGFGFMEAPTDTPKVGTTEIWRVVNTTMDAHPIHLHLVRFQILDRQAYNTLTYVPGNPATLQLVGEARPADRNEGWKDTATMYPGEVTRLIAKFDLPLGVLPPQEYVWHCHILEHEEHDMMRPLIVMP